jgi:hypothetical protein
MLIRFGCLLLALSCGVVAAADVPLDVFGRPVAIESRLAGLSPGHHRMGWTTAGAGEDPGWRLLPFETREAGADPRAIAVGHVSGGRRPDVLIATSFYFDEATDHHLFFFRPEGKTGFLDPLLYPYGQMANFPSVAVLDLDGTHGADVVVGGGAGITRFLASAGGTLTASAPELSQTAMALAAVDLNRNGWPDVVSISWSDGGMLHRNFGNGSFQSSPWSVPVAGYNVMGSGDIDGDGLVDVVVGSGQGMGPYIRVHRNTGAGSLVPMATLDGICPGASWGSVGGVAIGDVNGDGHADVIASSGGNSPGSCIMIFHGDGTGSFAPPVYLVSYDIPQTLRVADIDGDGLDDVIVAHGGWMALGVYLQQANGSLAPERLFPLPYASHYYAHSFEVVDLDLDGCADVALVDYNHGLVTLRGFHCVAVYASGFE